MPIRGQSSRRLVMSLRVCPRAPGGSPTGPTCQASPQGHTNGTPTYLSRSLKGCTAYAGEGHVERRSLGLVADGLVVGASVDEFMALREIAYVGCHPGTGEGGELDR
jgi:hypothetical protein